MYIYNFAGYIICYHAFYMLYCGMFCTWHLWLFWCVTHLAAIVYYIIVCPTHSRRYRTNVLFTTSRIIFCHYFACSWFALDILWFPFFTWSLVGACIAQLSYAIVECLGYLCLLDVFPFQFTIAMGSMKARQKPRNTPTKFEGITKFLIFVGVI